MKNVGGKNAGEQVGRVDNGNKERQWETKNNRRERSTGGDGYRKEKAIGLKAQLHK